MVYRELPQADDPLLAQSDLFVLDGSNRASVLALSSFVVRVSGLDIGGITFREIGELKKSGTEVPPRGYSRRGGKALRQKR